MNLDNITTLTQALLNLAQERGFEGLTITALTKFIYLADVYYARKNGGETFTGVQWKFHHFGPCSYSLSETIQKKIPNIQVESDETKDEGHIFILIKLSDHGCRKTMQDTGLGIAITSSLESNLKKFGGNLNPLLEYVYFHTEPMENAMPGDILDFNKCEAVDFSDFQSMGRGNFSQDKIKKGKQLLAALRDKKETRQSLLGKYTPPKYDIYYNNVHYIFDKTEDISSYHVASLMFEN